MYDDHNSHRVDFGSSTKESVRLFLALTFPWALAVIAILLFSGCGKTFCPIEYKIDNQWRRCSFIQQAACGIDLQCDGVPIQCLNGVEQRTTECR